MKPAHTFFSKTEKEEIVASIAKAEAGTSGEIRVHVEDCCAGDPFERGVAVFGQLGMHKTELKNGVLFYLAVSDRKFSIVADKGINEAVPADFWNEIKSEIQQDFKGKEFSKGLCKAIEKAGLQLSRFFPIMAGDKNELSNEISES